MKKIFAKLLQKESLLVSAILFLLVLLAYGLLTPRMGFYWDDWPFAWFLKFFGPAEFIESFRPFRPFLGPIFTVTTALFGGDPFTWQLVGLAFRFFLSLEIWYVLRYCQPRLFRAGSSAKPRPAQHLHASCHLHGAYGTRCDGWHPDAVQLHGRQSIDEFPAFPGYRLGIHVWH